MGNQSFVILLQVNSFEQNACAFLKEVVKANKMLQRVQQAAEGIKGNVVVQVIIRIRLKCLITNL
jgi:hypothetical protein